MKHFQKHSWNKTVNLGYIEFFRNWQIKTRHDSLFSDIGSKRRKEKPQARLYHHQLFRGVLPTFFKITFIFRHLEDTYCDNLITKLKCIQKSTHMVRFKPQFSSRWSNVSDQMTTKSHLNWKLRTSYNVKEIFRYFSKISAKNCKYRHFSEMLRVVSRIFFQI